MVEVASVVPCRVMGKIRIKWADEWLSPVRHLIQIRCLAKSSLEEQSAIGVAGLGKPAVKDRTPRRRVLDLGLAAMVLAQGVACLPM